MQSGRERYIHKRFTPADAATWGSVDTWVNIQRVDCQTTILSATQTVQAGRDTADRIMRVYFKELKHPITANDYLSKSGVDWLVLNGSEKTDYVDCRAVQG